MMLLQKIFLGYVTMLVVILGDAPEVVGMLPRANHVCKPAAVTGHQLTHLLCMTCNTARCSATTSYKRFTTVVFF